MAKGMTYVDSRVDIDGKEFLESRFENCEFVYSGGALPTLGDCVFVNCRWSFVGPAGRTIQLMSKMYAGGMRELIEHTFDNIRGAAAQGITLN